MASVFTPCLTDPDKLGLLIQCRQKMDQLNANDLRLYSQKCIELLSNHQLKNLLFVGFNSIKNGLEYNQLFQMKSSINQIIEKAKKLKEKSNPTTKAIQSIVDKESWIIPKVPKNASLSKIIPKDIISNNICQYLKMSSITNLAKCDRKLSVICSTPISIKNLMHRYDPYKYAETEEDYYLLIDGHFNWNVLNKHKMQNVETLSIALQNMDNVNKMNLFHKKVKHLNVYDKFEGPDLNGADFKDLNQMSSLQSIAFINIYNFPTFLSLVNEYQNNSNNHQLKSIGFIDSCFDSLENYRFEKDEEMQQKYRNITNFILPSQPNSLETLKFENSIFEQTDHPQTNDANKAFQNIDRIKTSLSNLNGFVYGGSNYENNDDNQFYNLSRNILRDLVSFKNLESIHTHSPNNELIPLYLNNNNSNALNKMNEFCVSVSMNQATTSPLRRLRELLPNLEKLCLVINVTNNDESHITNFAETIIKPILQYHITLKMFQIVAVMEDHNDDDSKCCLRKINILSKFGKILVKLFYHLRSRYDHSRKYNQQRLVLKFHVKSCHLQFKPKCTLCTYDDNNTMENLINFAQIVQDMMLNYLMTYSVGKIQCKFSWNADEHYSIHCRLLDAMKGLNGLCNVDMKTGGNVKHLSDDNVWHCESDMDYRTFAISAIQKNLSVKHIDHEKKWKVDCRYCCNTPWV